MEINLVSGLWHKAQVGVLALLVLAFSVVSAEALDLQSAKAQGLVGEQANGYVGIVSPPGSAELQQLVAAVNLKRRELYQQRAASMSPPVSLQQYEAVAGATLIKNAKRGEYVQDNSGKWIMVQ